MKYIFVFVSSLAFLVTFSATAVETNTGKTISGPGTMGHPTYPNSGPLRNRSNDITGKNMSDSTMSSDVDPAISRENQQENKAAKKEILKGPYNKDNSKFHKEAGPEGKEAQEAAKEKSFDQSEKEIKRKQHGY